MNYNLITPGGSSNFGWSPDSSGAGGGYGDVLSFLNPYLDRSFTERGREFDAGLGLQGRQLGEQSRQFDVANREGGRQFDVSSAIQREQLARMLEQARIAAETQKYQSDVPLRARGQDEAYQNFHAWSDRFRQPDARAGWLTGGGLPFFGYEPTWPTGGTTVRRG